MMGHMLSECTGHILGHLVYNIYTLAMMQQIILKLCNETKKRVSKMILTFV